MQSRAVPRWRKASEVGMTKPSHSGGSQIAAK